MPQSPAWHSKINEIVRTLESLGRDTLERQAIETLLGVGERQARRVMAECCGGRKLGSSLVVERPALLAYLKNVAAGGNGEQELHRREEVASKIGSYIKDRQQNPVVIVPTREAMRVFGQQLDIEGLVLEPGRITVVFRTPEEAVLKLMGLAKAAADDFEGFAQRVRLQAGAAA